MPRKKESSENEYDYLEKKYNVTPAQILDAIRKVGPSKARLETFFLVESYLNKRERSFANPRTLEGR